MDADFVVVRCVKSLHVNFALISVKILFNAELRIYVCRAHLYAWCAKIHFVLSVVQIYVLIMNVEECCVSKMLNSVRNAQ